MKNNAETSTNYIMLFFVAIINIFMALSLNSFSSSDAFLPALFLYFISNLATFLEKINTYEHIASAISILFLSTLKTSVFPISIAPIDSRTA